MLKRLKKGFTLAELLIVVAIIAVLTAIAVPLFVTSLKKAQDATDDANIRAVRGAAVVAILSTDKPAASAASSTIYTNTSTDGSTKTWELVGPWVATGTLDGKGNITGVTVTLATGDFVKDGKLTDKAVDTVDGTTVTVYITITELPK